MAHRGVDRGAGAASATAERPRRGSRVRVVAAAVLIVAGVLLLGRSVGPALPAFAGWVEAQGAWGAIVFVSGYAIATVAFLPGSVLTVAAGAIFGLARGTALVFVGAVLGSTAAFLVSRHLARPLVERRFASESRYQRLDGAIGAEGFRIVLLLRLSPFLPYNLLNYALGLTRVRLPHYLAASIGMLPGTVLYVYSGTLAGELLVLAGGAEVERGAAYFAVLGLGLVATAVVTVRIAKLATRALQREMDDDIDAET